MNLSGQALPILGGLCAAIVVYAVLAAHFVGPDAQAGKTGWKPPPPAAVLESQGVPFMDAQHRENYEQARQMNPSAAITIVDDMIGLLRAQDAGRANGYSWPDAEMVDTLRVKLNIWVLEDMGGALLPGSQGSQGAGRYPARPAEPKHPKAPPAFPWTELPPTRAER